MNTADRIARADPFDVALGQRLRDLRVARGLSSQDVADIVGVTPQQLGKYESGETRMKVAHLARFAPGLGVTIAELLGAAASPSAASDVTDEAVRLLSEPGARDLLRGYAGLPRGPMRQAVLDLLKTWRAWSAGPSKRG